jgi:hypothetical protein
MILEGNVSNEDILDQVEKIEVLEEEESYNFGRISLSNIIRCQRVYFYHEYPKIAGWSS